MEHYKRLIVLAVVLLAIFVAFGGIAVSIRNKKQMSGGQVDPKQKVREKIADKLANAKRTLFSGNSQEAVPLYNEAITELKQNDLSVTSRKENQLATAELRSGKYKEALRRYKDVIFNERPKEQHNDSRRAVAISLVAELTLFMPDDLLWENVYKEEPFLSRYVKDDPLQTYYNMLKWSYETFKAAPVAYDIANFDTEKLIERKTPVPTEDLTSDQTLIAIITQFVQAGDLYAKVAPETWDPDRLLICNFEKARVAYLFDGHVKKDLLKSSLDESPEVYLEKAMQLSGDPFVQNGIEDYGSLAKIAYVSYWIDKNDSAMNEKINSIIVDVVTKAKQQKEVGFYEYLRKIGQYPETNFRKQELLKIAQKNTAFAEFLKEVGWK